MKARALVILLLVVAACFVAWSTGLLALTDGAPSGVRRPAIDPREAIDLLDPLAPDSEAPAFATERTAATTDRGVRRVRVTTVDRDSEPVPGAVVRYRPPRTSAQRERDANLHDEEHDLEAVLRAAGNEATTDATGVAEIVGDPDSTVCARAGELYGEGDLGSEDDPFGGELRIELRRDATLRVEVVDTDGRPVAGMRVWVQTVYVSRRRCLEGEEDVEVAGPDGVVVVPHVLQRMCAAGVAEGRLRIRCVRDNRDRSDVIAERTLSLSRIDGLVPVRLVVPAAGAIRVAITDADGATIAAPCRLWDATGDDFDAASPDPHGWLFPHVPLHRSWQLRLGEGRVARTIPVIGPRTSGEVVQVDVSVPIRRVELRAKIECRDGRPMRWAMVKCRCSAFDTGESIAFARADGSLRFRGRFDTTAPQTGLVELATEDRRCAPHTAVVKCTIGAGVTDLGTFVVDPPGDEALLATVSLRCEGTPLRTGGWASLSLTAKNRGPIIVEAARGADGTIVLRGRAPAGPMLLSCGARGCVGQARPVRVGEHVTVDLQRAAQLSVAVLAPDAPLGELTAELTAEGRDERLSAGLDDEGQAFSFDGVAPGRHGLRVLFGNRVVFEEAALELQAGINRLPADGSRLDLRSHTRSLSFVVRSADAAGDYVREWEAMLVPGDATELPADTGTIFRNPWFVPGDVPKDVLVRAPGHVPARVPAPRHDVLVRLQPATELRVDVDADASRYTVRVVEGALHDPLLRAFDKFNTHTGDEAAVHAGDRFGSIALWFVPGTIVEFTLWRGDEPGHRQRVVIGSATPQQVTLR